MENLNLLEVQEQTKVKSEQSKHLPYFIVIEKHKDKILKIPCSNEAVAKKVLAGLKGIKN